MILYHGSNVEVRHPRLLEDQRALDFGRGFYTTSSLPQASAWAQRTARIRKSGRPQVSVFYVDKKILDGLRILSFSEPNEDWLDFVSINRAGEDESDAWDVVFGPVANDQTMPTLVLFLDGYLSKQQAIEQLLPQKLKDQVVFKTQNALRALRFAEVISL